VTTKGLTTLAAAVERHTRTDGDHATAVPGLWLYRFSAPSEHNDVVYVPSLCIVAQGAKEVVVGSQAFRYDPAQSLLVSVDLPASTRVAEATADRPCWRSASQSTRPSWGNCSPRAQCPRRPARPRVDWG
jgi:AraC-type transcriptional regulator N-terminus